MKGEMPKMATNEMLTGTVETVIYQNPANDYAVIELVTDVGELITAVGILPFVAEGENLHLHGKWAHHPDYGQQFTVESFEKFLPTGCDDILRYLSSRVVKGIGPVTALKIVNRFKEDSFDVIENHPEWLADIPGITMKKAAQIAESFREQTGIRGVMMLCKDYISPAEVTKVYKKYGGSALGIIEENPYILCGGELGISFDKIDDLAKTMGHPLDSSPRVLAGIEYLLGYNGNNNGHTCLPTDKLLMAASQLLSLDMNAISDMIDAFIRSGDLGRYREGDREYIMTHRAAEAEDFIAKTLHRLSCGVAKYGISDISSLLEQVEAKLSI
jgi:exodeoxyribonuclease V alpha subunit